MKKILIIRFSSLGDIILTFPVLRNIKLNDKNIKIYYLTKKSFSDILKSNQDVDEVVEFDGLFKTIKKIKDLKFDAVIDLHSNLRSFIFRHLVKGDKTVRYNKDSLYRRLFVNFRILSARLNRSVVEKYLKTVEELGFKVYSANIELNTTRFLPEIKKKINKILIIQTAFLGDLILTLPLVREIKNKIPDSYIAMLVRAENVNAVRDVKQIDEIITDNKKEKSFFAEFFRILSILKSKKFDIALIPHRSLRSALLGYLSGIKIRIGFDIKPQSFFYTHRVPFEWLVHDALRNNMLLSPLISNESIIFPSISHHVDSLSIKEKIDNIVKNKPVITINPSSAWETKRWPDYKFTKLVEEIYNRYSVPVIFTGSKKESEYISGMEKILGNKCINMAGKTSLSELIYLIKESALLITNDSGPMHIASATSTPILAIFGPTTRELGFFPYGSRSVVMESSIRCRPCTLHGSKSCPRGHFLCMKMIKVRDVLNEVEKILKYKYE